MFINEEKAVSNLFTSSFHDKVLILTEVLAVLEEYLIASRTPSDEYSKYAAVILIGSCLKSLVSSLDRLSKGYVSDSEALLKKAVEGFFYVAYFSKHTEDAKIWCTQNKKPDLNYKDLAIALDKDQSNVPFFPTNYDNFFTTYIYDVVYKQANRLAHHDFDLVHEEMGLDNKNPTQFATTMVLGPKFDQRIMKTTLFRITMFSMFLLSILLIVTDMRENDKYKEIFKKVTDLFWEKEEE